MINSSSSDTLPFKFCSNHRFYLTNDAVTILTCVISALLAPIAVAGNYLFLVSIWRNPSLRTPSYTFLCGLALTDLCTGLFGQPFYVLYRVAELKVYKNLYCVASAVAHSIVPYFVTLTGLTITAMAVERWFHMSRRSLITVRRVYIIETTFAILLIPYMAMRRLPGMAEYFYIPIASIIEGVLAFCCFAISSIAYFKVFRIIQHHQQQVHANTNSAGQDVINLEKYRKSVHTILWILALFLFCYAPFVLSTIFTKALDISYETSLTVLHLSTTVLFMSSSLNPFLYIWRLKDIRNEAKHVIRKIFCRGT